MACFREVHGAQKGRLPLEIENNEQQVSALISQLVDRITDISTSFENIIMVTFLNS